MAINAATPAASLGILVNMITRGKKTRQEMHQRNERSFISRMNVYFDRYTHPITTKIIKTVKIVKIDNCNDWIHSPCTGNEEYGYGVQQNDPT